MTRLQTLAISTLLLSIPSTASAQSIEAVPTSWLDRIGAEASILNLVLLIILGASIWLNMLLVRRLFKVVEAQGAAQVASADAAKAQTAAIASLREMVMGALLSRQVET